MQQVFAVSNAARKPFVIEMDPPFAVGRVEAPTSTSVSMSTVSFWYDLCAETTIELAADSGGDGGGERTGGEKAAVLLMPCA